MNPEQMSFDDPDNKTRLQNLEGRLDYWDNEREVALRALVVASSQRLKVRDEITRLRYGKPA